MFGGSTTLLHEAVGAASAAEACGQDEVAGEAWRRYRLIRDAARDPDDLPAEGIALSLIAIELARANLSQALSRA